MSTLTWFIVRVPHYAGRYRRRGATMFWHDWAWMTPARTDMDLRIWLWMRE